MRFTTPTVPAGTSPSGGYSGIPSWRKKWLSEQRRMVLLECGHIEDLSIQALTIINAFDGCEIDCIQCERFVRVKKALRPKKAKLPDEPLF